MAGVVEDWGGPHPRHRVDWTVEVSGSDACVEAGHRRRQYRIGVVEIAWEWIDPNADDAPGEPFVTLRTVGQNGRLDGGKLFLDQVRGVPDWLQDIIIRSMPRL